MENITSTDVMPHLKRHHYPHYIWVMLMPKVLRQTAAAICALDEELASIPGKVSEPMLGHIRYSWWQENIEALHAKQGEAPHQHPLLAMLAEIPETDIPPASMLALVELHRSAYDADEKVSRADLLAASRLHLQHMFDTLMQRQAPDSYAAWQKRSDVLTRHGPRASRLGLLWRVCLA